ncbi:MAG: alpha/beta hydrolase [Oscillospiraceae bacterium]|nr:alpha/beta hydrolase [Oscillospiraceae bacterium]
MLYQAKNATVAIDDTVMEYIRFGNGPQTMIMLPGLGDGLRTMKGTALPMALMYRMFARDFTVYAFSRRNHIPEGFTTRDMAEDLAMVMEKLGIEKAHVLGVSMGGMIAQHLAISYPRKVDKLILTVTCPACNPMAETALREWISQAQSNDHTALMESNLRLIYSDRYYRKNKALIPLLGRLTKPASYDRFLKQAQACLTHDATNHLHTIEAPTLVIGGEQDRILGGDASRELAEAIPHARLHMYRQWGHGLYEEAGDFNGLVLAFLREDSRKA